MDTKPIGVLSAVRDAAEENTEITVESDFTNQPGKLRPLKINYIAPICDDDGECTDSVCDTGTVVEPLQDWFELTQCTASRVYTINMEDLRLVDGAYTFTDHARNIFAAALPDVRQKLNEDIAALLVANVGVLWDGSASMAVEIMNPTTGGMAPQGFWTIQQQYLNSGYANKEPYIIGTTQVFNWSKATEIAGMNTNAGFDLARARSGGKLYYDPLIQDTFADATVEHILTFNPDMIKFVSYSKNAGIFATDINNIEAINAMFHRGFPNLLKGGFVDPRTGLIWDLDVLFVECDNPHWNMQIKLHWDLWFMSAKVCNVQGLNSIFHFTTCLPQAPECGDNPYSPAPTAAVKQIDTTGMITYPLVVQKIQIGNQTVFNMPNDPTSVANIAALVSLLNDSQGTIVFSNTGDVLKYTGYENVTVTINETIELPLG